MRKEIIIAVLIGLSLGLVVAFGVRTARQSLANRAKASPTPKTTAQGSLGNNQSGHTLLITAPEPDQIVSKGQVDIIGTTSPQSMISIITGNDDVVDTLADDTGAFNATIELDSGVNTTTVTSYSPAGDEAHATFSLIYSTADLTGTSSAAVKSNK